MSGHEPVSNGRRAARFTGSLAALGLLTVGVVVVPAAPATAEDPPTNAIVAENALPGAPESEWEVDGAGDPTIQGFTTDISANLGGTVDFKIDATAGVVYDIKIYRLGYYDGDGARLVHTIPAVTGTEQPACLESEIPMGGGATTNGKLLDCGNWSVSASWQVPADATSGVYIARPTRTDDGGASHIPFIVRDDDSTSDLLFQTSDTTWQSYNPWGGYNAYGTFGATMAEKLSYNRPFATRGGELENYLFNAEYPMIRWLERNGYDVSYMSAIDTERHANLINKHDVFLSVGHDEYWSQGRRTAVTEARDAGVHLAFFSGNEIYWKTRWEPSTADGGSTDFRTQVVYKEGSSAPKGAVEHRNCYDNYECDPSDSWTGQWREAPGSFPENELSGQISWRLNTGSITVPAEYAPLRFWRDTDVAALAPGGTVTLADGTLGYEWNPEYPEYAGSYPAGRVLLSTTTTTTFTGAAENHHLSLYRAASGALVFGAGTVQWAWGLDSNHDRGSLPEDPNVQQATVNLLADMGAQPASLQSNLVLATPSSDTTPPVVTVTSPAAGATVPGGSVTVTGTATDAGGGVVGAIEVSIDGGSTWQRATGRADWSYTYVAPEGPANVQVRATDDSINLAAPITHNFTVATPTPSRPDPTVGPGGPVLVVDGTGPFGSYLPEIMRAEGLNLFTVGGVGDLNTSELAPYHTVILGETTLTSAQVTALTDWVQAGGNLVAMRPDPALGPLLGLTAVGGTLDEGYLRVDTTTAPGAGIVGETIQFHGVADRYLTDAGAGTQVVATLYSDASTATSNPAVTLRDVGTAGGSAAAFTYDLARSVVLTRQGNPAWADIDGDDSGGPVRADDLFHNGTDPDWVDLDKVAIPQADEQQRLLANILTLSTADALPLPRFWYLPGDEVAAVVMTADEHNSGDVRGRLEAEIAASPTGCSVDDWDCIRSTSYLYPDYPDSSMSAAEASAYEDAGFEIALHPDTDCLNPTRQEFTDQLTTQLAALEIRFPGLSPSSTSRIHCIAWSGYTIVPEVLSEQGIHLDTNYYYWPPDWLNDRPGMFTGSGFPQRFSTESGDLIDVYQATTQFTDESGQSFPETVIALIDGATNQGYYGTFVGNFHTDGAGNNYHGPVVAAAQAGGVPVISAKQLMTWTDGRNASSFTDMTREGDVVTFSVAPGAGANGLRAMLPVQGAGGTLQSLSRGGPVAYDTKTIKGVEYAVFDATAGTYIATYGVDETPPAISELEATPGTGGTATIRWTTNEAATSRVDYGTSATALETHAAESVLTTTHEVELTGLAATTTYHFRVTSTDGAGNTAVSPAPPADPAAFTMPTAVASDTTVADFSAGTTGSTTYVADTAGGEVLLSPTVGAEFSGTALPIGWESGPWTGGTATVAGGALDVDGAWARTTDLYDPNRVLEFRATFGDTIYSNAGLGVDFNDAPWAAFGVGDTSGDLYARVNNGTDSEDVALGAGYFGSPHTYRIEWTDAQVSFFIDGEPVHTSALAIAGQMRPVVSDLFLGSPAVSVYWLRMTPYASEGTFTSRIHDAGSAGSDWGSFSYVADVPAVTTLTFDVRTGETPTPDESWTGWASISQGADVATPGRYLQYRATATGDGETTPVLQSVTLPYTADVDPPAISDRNPAPGATGVAVDSNATVSFDEPMDPATITTSTLTLRAEGAASDVPATVTYSGGTATLNPTTDLTAETTYTVTVAGTVTDLAGNPLGTLDTWTFATATDPAVVATSKYVSVSPARLLDTRVGLGAPAVRPAVGAMVNLKVTDVGGVPASGVTAVTLNVTLTEPRSVGYVQVLPTGSGTAGKSSNLNVYGAGQTVANLVTVAVGEGGYVTLYDVAGGHLIADVQGYFVQADASSEGRYLAVTPTRLLDSRSDPDPMPGPGTTIELQVTGNGGVPASGVSSVALTVTATNSAGPGYVQVVPTGGSTALGSTSNVNLTGPGQTVANLVIVPLGVGGSVQLYNSSGTDIIADVVGYFTDSNAASSDDGLFVPLDPSRLVDTRKGSIASAKSETTLAPAGKAGLPGDGMSAVFLNVTATGTSGPGYLQVFPTGQGTRGASSSVNYTGSGQTVAAAAIGGLGTAGSLSIYTPTSTHFILDVAGYFTSGSSPD